MSWIVRPHEFELLSPLIGRTMLELGNKRSANGTYKDYFRGLGIDHTSVDLNGRDGALPLDLGRPLGLGRFDMVTNFGTSEHVECQEGCWRNLVNATGGVLVSTTPLPGDWPRHGRWYPNRRFYVQLASVNGLRLERLYVGGSPGRRLVHARLLRVGEAEFTMPSAELLFDNGNHRVGNYSAGEDGPK